MDSVVKLVGGQDWCHPDNYRLIRGEERRSAGIDTTGIAHCDRRLRKGWYRVESRRGTDMPTSCPRENTCGTIYPVWMEGTIPPMDGNIHNRTAYQNIFGDCSYSSIPIQVKNCGTYRVWHLSPVENCPGAYCFGDKTPCRPGYSSESGNEPCSDNYPKHRQFPVLDWKIAKRNSTQHRKFEVVFRCRLPNPSSLPLNVTLDVEWYTERPGEFKTKLYPPGERKHVVNITDAAILHEDDYTSRNDTKEGKPSHLGAKFSCSVRARFGKDGVPGPRQYSKPFFAGIEILTPNIKVKEGRKGYITVRPTIPILTATNKPAKLPLAVFTPVHQRSMASCNNLNSNQDLVFEDNKGCEISISSFVVNSANWEREFREYKSKSYSIPVSAKVDSFYGDRVTSVKLATSMFIAHPIWSYYVLPDIRVTITDLTIDLKGKFCKSVSDPYIRQFDSHGFSTQFLGEFILYQHKNLPIQVNIKIQKCTRWATCNCGVAVRSGKDVFIVDRCAKGTGIYTNPYSKYPTQVGLIGCDKKTIVSESARHGNIFMVTLPSGGRVDIHLHPNYTDAYVYPSVQDLNQTEGLCGNLNGNRADDLMIRGTNVHVPRSSFNRSILSWKVKKDESLFYGLREEDRYAFHVYCVCNITDRLEVDNKVSGDLICTYDAITDKCMTKGKKISALRLQKCGVRRRRRSAVPTLANTPPDGYNYNDSYYVSPPTAWINNWTELRATNFCKQKIMESPAGRINAKLNLGVDVESAVASCVNDIWSSGGVEYLTSSVMAVAAALEVEVKRNVTMWTPDKKTGELEPPPEIMDQMCLNNCSGNGVCHKEQCQCDPGFGDDDCSKELSLAPTRVYLTDDEADCRSDFDDCNSVPVNGDNFAESDQLRCKTRHCEVSLSGVHCTSAVVDKGEFEHSERVTCPLPTRRRRAVENKVVFADIYFTSVSNNGANFSEEVKMIVYDSHCVSCNVPETACSLKRQACIINKGCFLVGQAHPAKRCLTCQPDISVSAWTHTGNECLIGGICYSMGTNNPEDQCQMCNVTVSVSHWSYIQDCQLSAEPTSSTSPLMTSSQSVREADGTSEAADNTHAQPSWVLAVSLAVTLLFIGAVIAGIIIICRRNHSAPKLLKYVYHGSRSKDSD